MRTPAAVPALVAAVLVALGGSATASPAPATAPVPAHVVTAKKALPDLVQRGGKASYDGAKLTVKLTFANVGSAKAPASTAAIGVDKSKKVTKSSIGLGEFKVPALKPRSKKTVPVTVTVPANVPVGTYHVVSCADWVTKLRESNEGNNCGGTKATVKITHTQNGGGSGGGDGGGGGNGGGPGTSGTNRITITAQAAGTGGTVAAIANGAACPDATCTLTLGQANQVSLTATAATGYTFTGWVGACGGYTGTSTSATIGFTNPTATQNCVAGFDAVTPPTPTTVTVGYTAGANGVVGASTTAGSCASGVCTVPVGAATVTLTATANALFGFTGWTAGSGGPCDGVASGTRGSVMTFTNPAAAKDCHASFSLLGIGG
jgi:hypothetical protein